MLDLEHGDYCPPSGTIIHRNCYLSHEIRLSPVADLRKKAPVVIVLWGPFFSGKREKLV